MKSSLLPLALLALCSLAPAEPVAKLATIADQEWQLVSADSKPARANVTLRVTKDGKVSGRAPVNSNGGEVTLDGKGGCKWGSAFFATQMAGPPELMDAEQKYFDALPKTVKVDLTDGTLTFSSGDGKTKAVFRKSPAAKRQ